VVFSFLPILTGQYYLIFIGYVLFGIFSSPIGGFADSLAIKAAEAKGIDFGKIRVWASVGWLSSTLLLGFVLAAKASGASLSSWADVGKIIDYMFSGKEVKWNDTIVIIIVIVFFLLTFLSALGFRELKISKTDKAATVKGKDFLEIFRNKPFLFFLVVVVMHIVCLRSYYFLFGIHVQTLKLSPTVLSIAATVATLSEIFAFNYFGKLKKWLRLEWLIVLAAGISILRWIVIGASADPAVLIGIQVLQSASSGIFIAAAVSLVADMANEKLLVTYQQIYNYAIAGGNLIGTYLSALIYDRFSSAAPVFNLLGVFEGFAIVLIIVVASIRKKASALQRV
jgi:PPP family 3-phenylpropionic acid transporter